MKVLIPLPLFSKTTPCYRWWPWSLLALFGFVCFDGPDAAADSPYPNMARLNGAQPILDESGAMFPSLVKVPEWVPPEKRAHPEAVYYLYWATHYGTYIRLSWSRTIEGPYTEFNSLEKRSLAHPRYGVLSFPDSDEFVFDNGVFVYAHISSPEVLIDHDNQLFVMFFHGPSNNDQKSFVSTSPYGLNFNPVDLGGVEGYGVVPQILNVQYMRPFSYDGERYSVGMHGVLSKAPDNGPPYLIPPGTNPVETYWTVGSAPVSGVKPRHAAARVRDGRYLDYFFSRRIENERIEVATIDMAAGDWTSWFEMTPSVTVIDNSAPWEGDDTRDPAIYEEDGSVYLLYAGGGENGIGLALLEGTHPLPEEPLPPDYDPEQVVDWGIQEVTSSSGDFRNQDTFTFDGLQGYPFSETDPLNPSGGYVAQPFYGGIAASLDGTVASHKVTSSDQIDLRTQDASTLHVCLVFNSTDFHGDPAKPLRFGKYSSLRIKLDRNPGQLRFLVREGDAYFVSEILINQSGELRFTSEDEDGNWAPYDPHSSLNFDQTQPFQPQNFENITGVGIMVDQEGSPGNRYWLRVQEFEVNLEAAEDYYSWIAGFPGTGTATLPSDDPDKDGLANLLEFILDGRPDVPDAGLRPEIAFGPATGGQQTYLEFTPVRTDGVAFFLESGDSLNGLNSAPFTVGTPGASMRVAGPVLTESNPQFLRLKVSLLPN